MTPILGEFTWLVNGQQRLNKIFSPPGGFTFVFPYRGQGTSLDLEDPAARFCTQAGLAPQLRLDLDPADCENQCVIGVFPQDRTSAIHIAHVPALHRGGGTFDVLVDTVIGCQAGQRPTRFRMRAAITYVNCAGDCNGDNAVQIDELILGVTIALGGNLASDCLPADLDSSGTLEIHELIAAVDAALQGCGG